MKTEPLLLLIPFAFTFLPAPAQTQSASDSPVPIYAAGPDIAVPQLLAPTAPHAYSAAGCRTEEQGAATFSVIVDPAGQPRNVYFLNPIGDDLDLIALREVLNDRFRPGARASQPVAVAASITVSLHACLVERKDEHGKSQTVLELALAPVQELKPPVDPPKQAVLVSGSGLSTNPSDPDAGIQQVGPGITAPVFFASSPTQSAQAETLLHGGVFKTSVVVDRFGLPERLKILDAEMPGYDQQVASVIRLYRWKPALKDGVPVPVRINVTPGRDSHVESSGRRR